MLDFIHFTIVDLLDILMVALLIFVVFRFIKGRYAINISLAIIIVLLVQIVASSIGMKMISSVLGTIIDIGAISLIVIFQPELRRFLGSLGHKAGSTLEHSYLLRKIFDIKGTPAVDAAIRTEIAEACRDMSEQKVGALIVIRRRNPIEDIIATGDSIDASISRPLIENIFFKNSPLHDGAMIIGNQRIIAARCTLPISDRSDIPARYGMRHKAAIGLSDQCDAYIIVVSEQTGRISLVKDGKIETINNINNLKLKLEEISNEKALD